MFHTAIVNLSPEVSQADATFGTTELGELAAPELIALLERFRTVDSVQNHHAEPHFIVTGRSGRFLVRTGHNKLFLYNARDSVEPYAELSAPEIVQQLERATVTAAPWAPDAGGSATTAARAAPHKGIAAAILVAGVALNGYTLYSVFYTESVNQKPVIALVTDAAELAAHQLEAVGTYATGSATGDRLIVVKPDGHVRFAEVGSKLSVNSNVDTYRLGKREKQYCLTTVDSGVVDVVDIDTVVYYRDTYRRTR